MSNDKKRDRDLQRRVRERQSKTGESYQAAWRNLTESAAPPSADTPPAMSEVEPDAQRQEAQRYMRQVIPLHLPRVMPNQPTRVAARAAKGAVYVERLHLSGAGTPGGAADWIVNDVEIDGRSQLPHKDLPGSLFGGAKVTALFNSFDPVERDHEVVVVVTYVGPNPEGVPFFAAVMGTRPAQRLTIVPIASKSPLSSTVRTTITAHVQRVPFQMQRLVISAEGTRGGAADWIVGDLRINGLSQFVQSGDIPGDMFSTTAIDSFMTLEECRADSTIEIDMIYIGLNEGGAIFTGSLEGTVLRDDYSVPPPDLHVVVETAGQGPGEPVIATCNWRAPATDNCTR